jgi:5,10-methylenetetrahydromethanopterin reductase
MTTEIDSTDIDPAEPAASPFSANGAGRSVVDAYIEQTWQVAAEGYTRVRTAQMPWEPDLMSVLAVALRGVQGIELGTAVLPIQVAHPMLTAQRALGAQL